MGVPHRTPLFMLHFNLKGKSLWYFRYMMH